MRPTGDGAAPSRRHLLLGGLGLGAFVLTGCTATSAPAAVRTHNPPRLSDLSPDAAAAVEVGSAISHAQQIVVATVAAHRALGPALRGFGPMHAVHLATLRSAVPGYFDQVSLQPPTSIPTGSAAALRFARSIESDLHVQLVNVAVAAHDGRYAGLFGSMSAAISQQLAAVRA